MSNLSLGAQPPLEFIPPDLNLLLLKGCQIFLPLWLQTQTNLRDLSKKSREKSPFTACFSSSQY